MIRRKAAFAGYRLSLALLVPVLLVAGAAVMAQDKPSPTACFQKFIDAVLSDKGASDATRSAELEHCFDFEAWATEKQKRDAVTFSGEERDQLRADWQTLLASEEFRDNWKRKGVRIVSEQAEGVEIALQEAEGPEQRIRIRMKRNTAGDFWRWYWSEPIGAKAAESPLPAPKTNAEWLKAIAARLDEIARAETDLAAERAELQRQQRRLLARAEEEQGRGPQGTPTALAQAAGAALMSGRWDDFAALHRGKCGEDSRKRFIKQSERINGWTVNEVSVTEPGRRAIVNIEVAVPGRPARTLAMRVVKDGARWSIDETP